MSPKLQNHPTFANKVFFPYGELETEWLNKRDPILGACIKKHGHISRAITPDPFMGLIRAISGQQISGKAHSAIWKRFLANYTYPNPAKVLDGGIDLLRQCGVSQKKALTILNLAREFSEGEFNNLAWERLSDEAISQALIKIPGIGPWTIEMSLIFTFQRKNILSFGDLAIRRGMSILYGVNSVSKDFFNSLKLLYSPYATIAGFYLWEVAAQKLT